MTEASAHASTAELSGRCTGGPSPRLLSDQSFADGQQLAHMQAAEVQLEGPGGSSGGALLPAVAEQTPRIPGESDVGLSSRYRRPLSHQISFSPGMFSQAAMTARSELDEPEGGTSERNLLPRGNTRRPLLSHQISISPSKLSQPALSAREAVADEEGALPGSCLPENRWSVPGGSPRGSRDSGSWSGLGSFSRGDLSFILEERPHERTEVLGSHKPVRSDIESASGPASGGAEAADEGLKEVLDPGNPGVVVLCESSASASAAETAAGLEGGNGMPGVEAAPGPIGPQGEGQETPKQRRMLSRLQVETPEASTCEEGLRFNDGTRSISASKRKFHARAQVRRCSHTPRT